MFEITRVRGRLTFEQVGQVKELFTLYDKDKSNELCTNELRNLLLGFDISLSDSSLQSLIKAMDENDSGLIEFEELLDWFPTILALKRAGQFRPPVNVSVNSSGEYTETKSSSPGTTPLPSGQFNTSNTSGNMLFHTSSVDWAAVRFKLPFSKHDEEQKAKREDLFHRIDYNGNGYISLAEADKGIRDEIKLPSIYHTKPVIMRAFQTAKDVHVSHTISSTSNGGRNLGPNYVERSEFRLFLKYLYGYFQLWEAFDTIDADGDRRVDKNEFTSQFAKFVQWGYASPSDDPSAVFDQMDVNKGGYILFDELTSWALKHSLLWDE